MKKTRLLKLKREFRKNKRQIAIISFLLFASIIIAKIGLSYFYTSGDFSGTSSVINIPSFSPKINNSYEMNQTINLSNTITNGKRLAPGAVGKFKIDVDFTNVDLDSSYRISFDRTNIPNNIKFYTDENLTSEITVIDGVELNSYSNKLAEHYIYWTWIYSTTEESNINDSLYINTEIILPFTAEVQQKETYHTFKVNNNERQSGRIYLSGSTGSFEMNFDFTNITNANNYNIYFNKEDKSSVLHLYSDELFQNEITSLSVSYDGEHNLVNNTIYWRLDDSSETNLYYMVYES